MFPMEKKSAGGVENVIEMQSDADDSARGCVPVDEVASAVAAVSDEIGDILKDELGDADKADRIELELADLSAELGILAGLADGEAQPGFPSLFEMAMVQNVSHSSTSSVECTWTNRRRPRPHNAKRAIAKGKESRRRRLGRRATRVPPMPDGVSDVSDVGADCDDSDEHQWTDTTASSESSSAKEGVADLESIFSKAEAPPMGQFLLPLLSTELGSSPPNRQHHRHSDMWQLMMGEEEMVVTDVPLVDGVATSTSSPMDCEPIMITPEDEVALLNFVCEGPDPENPLEGPDPEPLPAWLQSLYRAWGELGALLYTLVGDGASGWVTGHVLVAGTCTCSLCLTRAHNRELSAALLQRIIARLYTDENTQREAAQVFKALKVTCRSDLLKPFVLDCRLVNAFSMSPRGTEIIYDALEAMASRGELARTMIETVCLCNPLLLPMDPDHALERFVRILKCYAASSIILFKVDMYADGLECSSLLASRYLSHAGPSARERLDQIAARATPAAITAWTEYQHECNCNSAQRLCNEERKKVFRQLFFRMMKGIKTSDSARGTSQDGDDQMDDLEDGSSGGEMLEPVMLDDEYECYNMNDLGELVVKQDCSDFHIDDDSDLNSLNLTSSSLSSSSAAEAGSLSTAHHGGELVRTVRHLMRSIASIERLMQRVLKLQDHCVNRGQQGARIQVDLGLSEVDKKLMAMYKRLPEVHRKQVHVYKKQKKLSTACSEVVGGTAPSPPPPPAAPPLPRPHAPHVPAHALTYHLQRFHEVRRKVMHMKEQQLYYHRLRIWLEDQLKQNGDIANESNVKLVDDIKRNRRTSPRRITKHKSSSNKPYKILELLKQKAPSNTAQLLDDLQDDSKSDVDPPDAFTIDKDDLSDTDTIVGDEMCKEMKECLAKFANFALTDKSGDVKEFPESISPPLHEISPTSTEPMPVYSPNPNQRLLTVNKLLKRQLNKDDRRIDFNNPSITEVFNVAPVNSRRTPMLVEQIDKGIDIKASEAIENQTIDNLVEREKESYNKYMSMKKAFEKCETIIDKYGGEEVKKKCKQTESLSLEQICTALLNMENDPNKILVPEVDNEFNRNLVTKIIENLPQMIADLPKMATESLKTEFVSIINDLPELTNEDQLSPETLKQIRELKLTKNREKVTKNTSKRKTLRRPKTNSDDITMTLEFDSEDLNELIAKGGKEFETMLQSQAAPKEEFKHVIFSMAGKYALEKLFSHFKDETNPDIIGFLHLHKVKINTFMLSKASSLFDDYVKDAMSLKELMVLVRQRLSVWLNRVFTKYDHVEPVNESEIDEAIVKKFYEHIKEIAEKQCMDESYSIDDLEELRYLNNDKNSLKQITKLLSTSAGSAFDLIIMKLSHMSKDKKSSVTNLKFKYMEVISRCSESQQLASWIVLNPEIAASVIREMTGLPMPNDNEKPTEPRVEITSLTNEQKQALFLKKLREMNKLYLNSLPKSALSSGEWLLLLYRLEQLEGKLTEALTKSHAPKPVAQNNVSETHEAEILAARGLSKIIGLVKKEGKHEPVKTINLKPVEVKPQTFDDKSKVEESKPKVALTKFEKTQMNEALYTKYENVLKSNGHKELLELFYKIKSYLSKGQPVPECYTNQYIDMCSNIDMSLLNFELSSEVNKAESPDENQDVDAKNLSVIGSQNPELLAKYTAQALRNAKQTLNAVAFEVAFKSSHRNGSKSESDVCDAPKSDCNWTNDCICNTCQENEVTGSCISDIVYKQCYDMDNKNKAALDDKKKEVKVKQPVKPAKPTQPKPCDNVQHQQHVCKMGHSPSGSGSCASEGAPDQPCTCCYCTVFGHAPPVTTPVPRNFNETRERLRLILSKKKQKTGKPAPAQAEPPAEETKGSSTISQMFEKTYGTSIAAAQAAAAQANPSPSPNTNANAKVKLEQSAATVKPQVATKPQPSQTQPQPAIFQPPPFEQPVQLVHAKQQFHLKPQIQLKSQIQPATQPATQPKPVVQVASQPVQQESPQKPSVQPPSQQPTQPKPPVQPPTQQKPPVQPQTQQKPTVKQQQAQSKPEIQQPQPPPQQAKVQQKVANNAELEQKQLQERMAKMTVTDNKPKPLNTKPQAQAPDVVPLTASDPNARINPMAMEQIRQQQLKQQQLLLQQQQLKQAQQQQQLQQQQQWLNQQQQQEERRRMSISSCCSGSSHSSGESSWRGHSDPRDLDALLQYIEGPTRHVDRGKKRAKKLRQRAKKTESKMIEERESLVSLTGAAHRRVVSIARVLQDVGERHRAAKETLQAHRHTQGKKGKKPKLNPTQQAKAQQMAEQLGELNVLLNTTDKELREAQDVLADYTLQLEECEEQIREARDLLHGSKGDRKQQATRFTEHPKQHHSEEIERQRQIMKNIAMAKEANQAFDRPYQMMEDGGALRRAFDSIMADDAQKQSKHESKEKKQTWEQALAHMNQLVTKANKEKQKKPKEQPKPEPKPTKGTTRSNSLPDDTQNLSKKQRKLLARQQAEEEEARLLKQQQQQEAKNKKSDNKKPQETAKSDKTGKKDKMAATAEQNGAAGKRTDAKVDKGKDKKGKENKVEKNVQTQTQPQPKQPKAQPAPKQAPQPQPLTKKERKKDNQQKQQVTNNAGGGGGYINSDVGKVPTQTFKPTPPPINNNNNNNNNGCSIMSQLSSGVLVSDLRLPPGITLTRVCDTHRQSDCKINPVPVWKASELPVPPTPVARPPPIIDAHPSMMMFTQSQVNEPPKTIIMAEPPPPQQIQINQAKSKKNKKKGKKQTENQQPTTQFIESSKPDGTKMVTLRNPMFHSNLPPVHTAHNPVKKPDARPQDNMPLPANPCQATITPTSNGMYTIRNPLMSMMHQQTMMQPPQINHNQMYQQPNNYSNYVNPNAYIQPQPQAYVIDSSRHSPINQEKIDSQNRLLNLASFTQKNEEGYSLFKKEDSNNHKGFLNTDYYNTHAPNSNVNFPPTVSPNPIGTRPEVRHYEQMNDSLFANNSIHRPEPIGTGLKKLEEDKNEFRGGLYTPFGQEDRNVFRSALFDSGVARNEDLMSNGGEGLPYFQRLRAGSKLNSEVTIHHVTESKFYKEPLPPPPPQLEQPSEPYCYGRQCWSVPSSNTGFAGEVAASVDSLRPGASASPLDMDEGFGPVGTRHQHNRQHDCENMFARSLSDLSSSETMEAMQRYEQLYIQKQRMHQLNTN